jgi:hypothetical protein
MNRCKHLWLVVLLLCSGCVCVFPPCDRRLHVSGHVFDADHNPVPDAIVVLNGVRQETNQNGCFYFGGTFAASELDITVTKVGYKSFHGIKEVDFFETIITLEGENSERLSSPIWHKLEIDELPKYKDCGK